MDEMQIETSLFIKVVEAFYRFIHNIETFGVDASIDILIGELRYVKALRKSN